MATCPFCGEEILAAAKKCKHCHEFLDPVLIRSMPQNRSATIQPAQPAALPLPPQGICSSLLQLGQTRGILMVRSMSAEKIELAFRESEYSLLSEDIQAEMISRLTLLNNKSSSPKIQQSKRNRVTAGLLAIFLGGFGAHKFYLGRPEAWLYLAFFWTYIPTVIGIIEGIMYFATTDEAFDKTFNH